MGEGSGNNTAFSINFIPKMGIGKLADGYRQIVETIYSPEEYYRRCLTFLRGYRQKTASKIQLSGITALFKGIWHVGIRNEEGFRRCFWKLLFRCLVINPKTFGEAVRLLIVGVHFRKSMCSRQTPLPDPPFTWGAGACRAKLLSPLRELRRTARSRRTDTPDP